MHRARKIRRLVASAVLGGVLAVEAALLVPSYAGFRAEQLRLVRERQHALVQVAAGPLAEGRSLEAVAEALAVEADGVRLVAKDGSVVVEHGVVADDAVRTELPLGDTGLTARFHQDPADLQAELRAFAGRWVATALLLAAAAWAAALWAASRWTRAGAPPPPGPTPSPARSPARGPRVLLVEDNPLNRKTMERTLARLGYEVDLATNGLEAVEAVEREEYAAVLMDCQMPELDGFEATARIRARESDARRLPILALTASTMSGDRERCLEAGMDDYIAKPFGLEDLRQLLSRWLGSEAA